MRRRSALLAATALVAVAAGCAAPGGDKAGGSKESVVLTLESEDDLQQSGAPEFAEAVDRLSGGAMRIEFIQAGRGKQVSFEQGVVEDVRAGKAELGIVAVRVWDTLGVTSFRALLAPFLVDSYALERGVLESRLVERMLGELEQAGVVGVALLPGPLRRPFGITRALVGSDDYKGTTIGIRPGGVAEATFRALGATGLGYAPGVLKGLDGAELDPTTIVYNGYDRRALTANVVLWPKPYSIIMGREAFVALTPAQRAILGRAGREAIAPELRQIERDEAAAVSEMCRRGGPFLVTASSAELAALRRTVQPVYHELERDSETREHIAEIRALQKEVAASALAGPSCPDAGGKGAKAGATALEGLWETTWTRDELIAAGIAPKDAGAFRGHHTAEFAGGSFTFQGDPGSGNSATGTYTLDGDIIRLVFETGIALQLGRPYELSWNVYRDSLTFSAAPGRSPHRVPHRAVHPRSLSLRVRLVLT